MPKAFDVVVIGSGPGGYVCAIRAAQLGLSVAVIEKEASFGGACLRVGCIPSKALLHASELFEKAGKKFAGFGIRIAPPELDLPRMMAHKDASVDASVKGVAFLFKKNRITPIQGRGGIAGPGAVRVARPDGSTETLAARSIVIATGSTPTSIPGVAIDEKRVVSSTGALVLAAVPRRMVVIGAGVIGLELGSVWRRLGSEVTVVEFQDRVLPGLDGEVARYAHRIFAKQGMRFRLASKVASVAGNGAALAVAVEPAGEGAAPGETLAAEVVLVAIGRRAFTDGLGLEAAGVALDERGRIKIEQGYKTSAEGVYAIGDVVAGPMLAHKAEDEGIALAEMLAGRAGHVDYGVIPNVIYTAPEIASVGRSEEELRAAGVEYRTGKFPMTASGRARAMGETEGFVKVLADAATGRVLGVHIISANASELIAEAAVLMAMSGTAENLARVSHAHPTLSEAVREAAMAASFKAVHV